MSEAAAVVEKLAVIGAGLIGSSVVRAARQHGAASHIALADADEATLDEAEKLSLADSYSNSAAEAAKGADLVIMAVPVGAMASVAATIAPALKSGAIVSDVGVGESQCAESRSAPAARRCALYSGGTLWQVPNNLVRPPGSPACSKGAGVSLHRLKAPMTTPLARCQTSGHGWGSTVEIMSADHHDLVLAITSHVPHLIAYNIVGTANDLETVTRSEVIKYSAGGFRDFTRIAASDPTMWRDVFLNNKEAVLEMLVALMKT